MQKILILDHGGQHDQLIARRIRECHVFCEVRPASVMNIEKIRAFDPVGIVLSGDPMTGHAIDSAVFTLGIPVLAIGQCCCAMAVCLGGESEPTDRIQGRTLINLNDDTALFAGFPPVTISWMDYDHRITALPEGFLPTASTNQCPIAAFSCPERRLYGTMFHPEAAHTEGGPQMLKRFLMDICGAGEEWQMENVIQWAIQDIRHRVGSRKVLLALSGGVDSSVAAALLSRAVGSQLTCIFVDHGLLRQNEGDLVEAYFSRMNLRFVRVNAAQRFLSRLEGVTDPDEKRRFIGEEFVRVFEEEAKKLGAVDFLAQGTIYPDILENGLGYADVIRSHHEMNDLPDHIEFKELIEPLRLLFKDEVRHLGRTMGLPELLVGRQPFPGPGLAIRIMGNITAEKIEILRKADYIFSSELEKAHMHDHIGQYFAVLTDTQLYRTIKDTEQGYCLALRAVTTEDYTAAKWARLPYELLDRLSAMILRQIPGISRVVYDITSKPPASIEWE